MLSLNPFLKVIEMLMYTSGAYYDNGDSLPIGQQTSDGLHSTGDHSLSNTNQTIVVMEIDCFGKINFNVDRVSRRPDTLLFIILDVAKNA